MVSFIYLLIFRMCDNYMDLDISTICGTIACPLFIMKFSGGRRHSNGTFVLLGTPNMLLGVVDKGTA